MEVAGVGGTGGSVRSARKQVEATGGGGSGWKRVEAAGVRKQVKAAEMGESGVEVASRVVPEAG